MRRFIEIGLLLVLARAGPAAATNYYVDDDAALTTYDGLAPAFDGAHGPKKTVLAGYNLCNPGDTLYLRGGVYYESIECKRYGSPGNWITIKRYEDETPIMDGSALRTGWQQAASDDPYLMTLGVINPHYASIYWLRVPAAEIPANFMYTILTEDGELAGLCSEPNQSQNLGEDYSEFAAITDGVGETTWFKDAAREEADGYFDGAWLRIHLQAYNSTTNSVYCQSFQAISGKFFLATALPAALAAPDNYRIVNHPGILDRATEFYISPLESYEGGSYRRIYYWPTAPAAIETSMRLPARSYAFWRAVQPASLYLKFEGITARYVGAKAWYLSGASFTNRANHLDINDCTVHHTGSYGLNFLYLDNLSIRHTTWHHIFNIGLLVSGCNDVTVSDCNGYSCYSTTCKVGEGVGVQIVNNRFAGIRGGHGNALSTYGTALHYSRNYLIAKNTIVNSDIAFNYCGDMTVWANLFDTDPASPTVNFGNWDSGRDGYMAFYHNTCWECSTFSLMLEDGRHATFPDDVVTYYIANNIFHQMASSNFTNWVPPAWVVMADRTYNAYTSLSWTQTAPQGWTFNPGEQDLHLADMDDLFVDPTFETGDLNPEPGGPLAGTGKPVLPTLIALGITTLYPDFDFTTDLDGDPWGAQPSLGAYEVGGASPPVYPDPATAPSPAPSATGVLVTATLSWTAGAGATSHDVYLSTDGTIDAGDYAGNQAGVTYDPPGSLAWATPYWWRIDEVNDVGTTAGTLWTFTTQVPDPPRYLLLRTAP